MRWVVRVAVAWYKQGLGAQPQLLKDALGSYILDNDTLTQFLNERCEIGVGYRVNAAQLKNAYIDLVGHKIKQKDFQRAMEKRGYTFKVSRIDGRNEKVYVGLHMSQEI